ncbi:plasmid stabilization system protein [bacterium BMS3Abin07]|nr:plasmid stabilization system protein [bacterium BMS3Abin07]GBE32806.1 plasmid stabilization system protein [bacterium BMS3Bbin05]
MKYKVIVRPEAEDDLKEAFSWYEDKRKGLGYDFLFVNRNPEIHPMEYKGTRKHVIKRFPYKIIYLVEEEKIIILAVIHGKRKLDLTKKRIDRI